MSAPDVEIFGFLLAGYVVTSAWFGLDSRIPFAMAALVLIAAIVTYGAGYTGSSDAITGYIFLLVIGGVVLFLFDQVRAAWVAKHPSSRFATAAARRV